jgi:hypothetical protein
MTDSSNRPPTSGLASMTGGSGLTIDQVVARADRRLEQDSREFDRDVVRLLTSMASAFRDPAMSEPVKVATLYDLASQLLDIAGALDLQVFGEAIYAFSGLLDRMRRAARWNGPNVAVFIDTLRRLYKAEDSPAVAAKIVQGLKRVAESA